MPPNNCAVTATVTPYSEPTLSFPFSRKLPLNSFSQRELNAPLFYSYITPDYYRFFGSNKDNIHNYLTDYGKMMIVEFGLGVNFL